MPTYGLTDTGFLTKPLSVIRGELQAAIQAAFGASVDVGDTSVFGIILGILSEREALIWELAQAIYNSQDPDGALGQALDALSSLTGTLRPVATHSTVTLTLTGTPLTIVGSGSQVKTASTNIVFDTLTDETITALSAWVAGTTYALDDRVTANSRSYQCITAGTALGSGAGPSTTSTDITDNTVHWAYLGEGAGAIDVNAQSDLTGPQTGLSRDISVIVTPVSGWSTAMNLLDADPGRDIATDEELRQLRTLELAGEATSPINAIVAALLKVSGVTAVRVFTNSGDTTDSGGRPPHSIEALVQGGADQSIADKLLASVAAGIATYGTSSATSEDVQGNTYTISFSRPDLVNIYVSITLIYDPLEYPSDGDVEVKAGIVAVGDRQAVGKDAVASAIAAAALPIVLGGSTVQGVIGVLDVTEVLVYTDVIGTAVAWAGTTGYSATPGSRSVVSNDGGRKYICITTGTSAGSGGPTGTSTDITDGTVHWRYLGNTVSISDHQLAVFDTSRIAVHSSTGTP